MKNTTLKHINFPQTKTTFSFVGYCFLVAITSIPATVFACKDNIPGHYLNRYIDNKDGTISDKMTNLMWQKCTLGAVWNEQTGICETEKNESGFPIIDSQNWKNALERAQQNAFASHNDWRLPNIKELASIYDPACITPSSYYAIDLAVFDLPFNSYWSSTPSRKSTRFRDENENYVDTNTAYSLTFSYPSNRTKITPITEAQAVRLVRSQ